MSPHLRIFRRREAVEIDRIGARAHVAERRDVRKKDGQHDISELEPVCAGNERRPSGMQRARLLSHLGLALMQRAQIGEREGMLLERDEVQAAAACRIVLPCPPGDEEVQPEAEPRLEDDEALALRPARRQFVPRQEHMARLLRTAARAVVDVAVGRRIWRLIAPFVAAGDDRRAHARYYWRPSVSRSPDEQARRTEARYRSRLDRWQAGGAGRALWRGVQSGDRAGDEACGVRRRGARRLGGQRGKGPLFPGARYAARFPR